MTDRRKPDTPTPRHLRRAGTAAIAVGVTALVVYVVLGLRADAWGIPSNRLILAALVVVSGVALRDGRSPRWNLVLAGLFTAALAFDLIYRLAV